MKESFFHIHFVETMMILLEHLVWNMLGSNPWTSGLIALGHLYISLLNQISAPTTFFFFGMLRKFMQFCIYRMSFISTYSKRWGIVVAYLGCISSNCTISGVGFPHANSLWSRFIKGTSNGFLVALVVYGSSNDGCR